MLLALLVAPVQAQQMVQVPSGIYELLYSASDADKKGDVQANQVAVASFWIDTRAVTNREFLDFVKDNPRWRKSSPGNLLADSNYLAHWQGDLELGDRAPADATVVFVSWFAARAFCKGKGKRLPTVAQWEYVANASAQSPDGSKDKAFRAQLLEWYAQPADEPSAAAKGYRNYFGVYDMHGLIWEWNRDFNTALVTGESRGDSSLDRNLFCGSGSVGAADFEDYTGFMRFAFRSSMEGNYTIASLGFRCVCEQGCA